MPADAARTAAAERAWSRRRAWRRPRCARVGPGRAGRLAARGATGAGAQWPGRVPAGAGHDDVGPRHRRGRGRHAAHGLRRRRRHAGRHRRRLLRRRERAHPRATCSPTSSPGPTSWSRPRPSGRTGARADGPRRLPRAPAGRARRLPGAARAWTTSTSGSCTPGTTRRRSRRRWPPATSPSPPAAPATSAISNFTGWQTAQAATWQRAWPGPHAAGQHPGRVLAAAARRRARGRAGRGGARAGRARLVAAGPRPAHRQVPAQHAVGVPRRLAAVAGLHRRPALGEVRPDRRGGDHRRRGPGHHARWPSRWPGCATGPASSRRSSARAPPSSCRPRSTPTASGCPRRSAPRSRTSPRRRSAIPSAGPTR